jgi:enterochelin esterase-like enzyme
MVRWLACFLLPMTIAACSDSDGAAPGPETTGTGGAGGSGTTTDAAADSRDFDGSIANDAQLTDGSSTSDAQVDGDTTHDAQVADGSTASDSQGLDGSTTHDSQVTDGSTTDARSDGGAPTDGSGPAGVCPTTASLETLLGLADTSYYATTNVPHGRVTSVFFDWPASNNPVDATIPRTSQQQRSPEVPVGQERMQVYTPPGYETGTDRYPVLYLNHGTTDTDQTWLCTGTTTNLPSCGYAGLMLDNLIAAGKAVKMIIVTAYIDDCGPTIAPTTSNIKTTFGCTPKFRDAKVDAAYRTIADRHGRAMAGLSRGGWVTMQTGVGNVDTLFAELYVFSAAYGASTSPDLAGYRTALGTLLTDSAATNRLLDVPLYVAIGTGDTAVTGNATTMMAMFNNAGVKTLYQNSTGGHEWGNWRRYLHQTLQLMFKNSGGCP